jgi:hypothetical protein
MREKKRLGDMLVEAGLIDQTQLGAALGRQRQWGARLGTNLILMGFITEADLARFLSDSLKLPEVDLDARKAEPEALQLVKESVARQYNVLPLAVRRKGGRDVLELAMGDPTNLEAIDTVAAVTRLRVDPLVAIERDVTSAIEFYYRGVGQKPVARGATTPPPQERLALVRPGDEMVFDLEGGGTATPAEQPKPGPPRGASEPAPAPGGARAAPPPPPADARREPARAPAEAAGATRPSSPPASIEDVIRSIRETRAMVVVLAEMLMEQGVINQEEFYRRYGLKKILI